MLGKVRLALVGLLALSSCVATQEQGRSAYYSDLMDVIMCGFGGQPMTCIREKAGRLLDGWEASLNMEMRSWGDEADRDAVMNGRQLSEMPESPSAIGQKLMLAINELTNILQKSLYRFEARKKGESGGGIDTITISAGQNDDKKKKDKKKKKKQKPSNIHIHQGDKDKEEEEEEDKGVLIEGSSIQNGEVLIQGLRVDQELAGPAKIRIKRDDGSESDLEVGDGRGKKKKKKKAILKLLLLGAVLKAKIGLLLQLFSAHLQVKFFALALAGLALNIARFWLDLKKGHAPQKVIYYEHAQHQHHYEHEDDHGWGGYWSRSIDDKPIHKKEEAITPAEEGSNLAYGGWLGRSAMTRRK